MTDKWIGRLVAFLILCMIAVMIVSVITRDPRPLAPVDATITINTASPGVHLIDDAGREVGSLSGFGDEIVVRIRRMR